MNCSATRIPRNGTIYVAVLGVALIVAVTGIAAMQVARFELREAVAVDEIARGQLAAESGIEYAISVINSNSTWRSDYVSGVATTLTDARNILPGTGRFAFTFTDKDGDLADEVQDSVTLRSVGTAGGAVGVVEVLLQPSGIGLDCLSSSLHSQGQITVNLTTLTTDQLISANDNIDASTGTIQGQAAATGTVVGTVTETPISMNVSPAWEMPDSDTVFEYYIANGTNIALSSLAAGNAIERVVLSAANNPFGLGATNLQGIYVIDCQGASVTIKDCRIDGTLVLLNSGAGTIVKDTILWQPAVGNFPALLVQGSLTMDWNANQTLRELYLGVNLNPAGTPYNDVEDSDVVDEYAGGIQGLVYVTGDLLVQNQPAAVDGVIVMGGATVADSSLTLQYDSTFYNNPPPGFAAGSDMEIVPGSWKRVAY